MTESDMHKIVKNWLTNHGRILRIENTVSSGTVDAIIFYRGKALMTEYKIIRSGKIKVRKYQISTAADYTSHAIPNSQYNWFCACDGEPGIGVYSTSQLMSAPYTVVSDHELSIALRHITPIRILKTKTDFYAWLGSFD